METVMCVASYRHLTVKLRLLGKQKGKLYVNEKNYSYCVMCSIYK